MIVQFLWQVLGKLWKLVTSRVFLVSVFILVQIAILVMGVVFLNAFENIHFIFMILSWLMVAYILAKPVNPTYKIAWIILILVIPVFGGLFYLLFGRVDVPEKRRIRLQQIIERYRPYQETLGRQAAEQLKMTDLRAYKMANYIHHRGAAPVHQGTYSELLTPGEQKFEVLLVELQKAKKFIFLEYFILEYGEMWDAVLEVLLQKVAEGVEVRLLYDDLGSVTALPLNFPKQMARLGIQTKAFNRFRASLDVFMNHRDHRKICIIDGNVGITGGINIGDEYINRKVRFGHWKDTSILLKGEAVWNLTLLFLQMWEYQDKLQVETQFSNYLPTEQYPNDGFVQPFGDSPLDQDLVGETAYLNIIANAEQYVYISTPYLILDNEMITALVVAAQSGIEVRITTPHIPDKWFVHEVTRANYDRLIAAGVHIHEYLPGFIHAKTIVSDDKYAVVGTTNFDFRSFYLHFECGTLLYHTKSVLQVRDDYLELLSLSAEITKEDCDATNPLVRLARAFLAVFSPLL